VSKIVKIHGDRLEFTTSEFGRYLRVEDTERLRRVPVGEWPAVWLAETLGWELVGGADPTEGEPPPGEHSLYAGGDDDDWLHGVGTPTAPDHSPHDRIVVADESPPDRHPAGSPEVRESLTEGERFYFVEDAVKTGLTREQALDYWEILERVNDAHEAVDRLWVTTLERGVDTLVRRDIDGYRTVATLLAMTLDCLRYVVDSRPARPAATE
jgi:hypothetical protein